MTTIRNIRVITKDVLMRDDRYFMVRFTLNNVTEKDAEVLGITEGCTRYGTINKNLVGEDGHPIRPICLADMEYGKTPGEALDRRKKSYEYIDLAKKLGII